MELPRTQRNWNSIIPSVWANGIKTDEEKKLGTAEGCSSWMWPSMFIRSLTWKFVAYFLLLSGQRLVQRDAELLILNNNRRSKEEEFSSPITEFHYHHHHNRNTVEKIQCQYKTFCIIFYYSLTGNFTAYKQGNGRDY